MILASREKTLETALQSAVHQLRLCNSCEVEFSRGENPSSRENFGYSFFAQIKITKLKGRADITLQEVGITLSDAFELLIGSLKKCIEREKFKLSTQPKSCPGCGGERVFIRGRHPGDDNRLVCPTCLADQMADINEISSSNYKVPCEARLS